MGSSPSTSGIPESRTVLGQREGWNWAEPAVSCSRPRGRARREGVPSGHLLSSCSGPLRPLAGTTPQAAQRCGERLFRNPHLCCVTLRWQVLLGTRVPALTCRLVMSPLTHGDILSSYCPFPISTWMCPLAISGSATADEGESLEPPRPLLSSRGGYIPGTDTKAGTAQLQLTCTHTVSGERRQSGLTLPSPLPTDTAPSALGRQPLSPPEPAA